MTLTSGRIRLTTTWMMVPRTIRYPHQRPAGQKLAEPFGHRCGSGPARHDADSLSRASTLAQAQVRQG